MEVRIDELEEILGCQNSDLLPIVQNGATKKIQVQNLIKILDNIFQNINTEITNINDEILDDKTFSTTEKICGEWIDEKKIYRKVIQINLPATANTDSTIVDQPIEDFETLIDLRGTCTQGTNRWELNTYFDSNYYSAIYYNANINQIRGKVGQNLVSTSGYLTLMYTKTNE